MPDLSPWTHDHLFDAGNQAAERGTRAVMWITAAMMVVEIAAGWWFNSMALLADGWHMSAHALAIGLSAFAYRAARRYADDPRFAFGTWKIDVLGGFASALLLLVVAALMVTGSVERILAPQPIAYTRGHGRRRPGAGGQPGCAKILGDAQRHDHHGRHGDHEAHGDHAHHHDLNLKSAYLHVIADAATSVLAIVALGGGWLFGWSWLDPVMGIVGATLVALWAKGLLVETGRVLLDREMDHPVVADIREAVETDPDAGETRVADLHVWRVGRSAYACALTLVTHDPALTLERVREQLRVHEEIAHATIEIHRCTA
jgi:cation diffusion facilitator family transporter